MIGGKGETFQIQLDTSWFHNGEVLGSPDGSLEVMRSQTKLQLLTIPKRMNFKWYHRVINWLTFGYLCPTGFYYKVRPIE